MKTRRVQIQIMAMPKSRYLKAGSPNWWGYWLDDNGDPVWVIPRGISAREYLDIEVEVPEGKRVFVGAGPRGYPGVRYVFG